MSEIDIKPEPVLKVRVYAKAKNRILDDWVIRVGGNAAAARILGVSTGTISAWLNFKNVPTGRRMSKERFAKLAVDIARETGHSIQEIFPLSKDALKRIADVRISDRDVPESKITKAIEQEHLTYEESFIDDAMAAELRQAASRVLKTLEYRERKVLELRYGLGDGESYSLDEVAHIFKVTRERIRQIEAKAVRKLQQPSRAELLVAFVPDKRPDTSEWEEPAERWPSEIYDGPTP